MLPRISEAGGHVSELNPTQDKNPMTTATSVEPVSEFYIVAV
jgi:hypothetical protein